VVEVRIGESHRNTQERKGKRTMGVLLLLHVLLVAVAARAPATDAWGKEGHYMVCKIAEVTEPA
jgi:hypothetical protein